MKAMTTGFASSRSARECSLPSTPGRFFQIGAGSLTLSLGLNSPAEIWPGRDARIAKRRGRTIVAARRGGIGRTSGRGDAVEALYLIRWRVSTGAAPRD